jgi:hypothetical protein
MLIGERKDFAKLLNEHSQPFHNSNLMWKREQSERA